MALNISSGLIFMDTDSSLFVGRDVYMIKSPVKKKFPPIWGTRSKKEIIGWMACRLTRMTCHFTRMTCDPTWMTCHLTPMICRPTWMTCHLIRITSLYMNNMSPNTNYTSAYTNELLPHTNDMSPYRSDPKQALQPGEGTKFSPVKGTGVESLTLPCKGTHKACCTDIAIYIYRNNNMFTKSLQSLLFCIIYKIIHKASTNIKQTNPSKAHHFRVNSCGNSSADMDLH